MTAPELGGDRIARMEAVLGDLREHAGAHRTTLRIDFDDFLFPVVAETLAPGMHTIKGDATFDLRKTASSRAVLDTLDVLVQEDCTDHEFAPPPEFVELYGVRAQMIGPIVRDGRVIGLISVHSKDGPREWSPADRAALRAAIAELDALIGEAPAGAATER
jgi:maleate isomerase